MRLDESISVSAPRQLVWNYLTDPGNYLEFIDGLTRWESEDGGNGEMGPGARFRMLLRVGSAEVGGLIEIVEWDPPGDFAWNSVTGIDQRGRWRLRELSPRSTRVTLRFHYGVAGSGLSGLLAERVAARPLRRRLRRSLQNVRRAIEVGGPQSSSRRQRASA
ncbi:MAG: SRPBCC family protein [Solirubrobacterales bacterium]